jgi:hypothetical protein
LKITKTKNVLSLMLVVITILTTLTTTIAAAYAGGDDNNDDNGDGNKQKAEDDSAAAIADCDDNEVEEARFLCIALATNDVEIETEPPSEEPPEEGLIVCKVLENPPQGVTELDFELTLIDSSGNEFGIPGQPPPACSPRIAVSEGGIEEGMSPGAYTITERVSEEVPDPDSITVEGDCTLVDNDPPTATGEIQEGESQTCTFINTYEGGDG